MINHDYLLKCVRGGLAHSYDMRTEAWVKPYPEVTGYVLSYFAQRSLEHELCRTMADRLAGLQREDGGWATFDGQHSFFFDTIQIVHGLLDYYLATGEHSFAPAIERGLSHLKRRIIFGRALSSTDRLRSFPSMQNIFGWAHGDTPINTKIFEIEGKAQKVVPSFGLQGLRGWARRSRQIQSTHPGGYQIEGLVAMGDHSLALDRLRATFLPGIDAQARLPYHPGLEYEYNSGSVQIGILLFQCGIYGPAEAILNANVAKVSHGKTMGGLPQFSSIISTAELPHYEVNSWGTKYLLELSELIGNSRFGQ